MKIICEHCGSNIDVLTNSVCPNCKAPYNKNKEFLEKVKEQEEMKKDRKKMFGSIAKTSKKVLIIYLIIVISFIALFIGIFFGIIKAFNKTNKTIDNVVNNINIEEKINDIENEINDIEAVVEEEKIEFSYTEVKFSNDLTWDNKSWYQPKKGYTFVLFKINIKNISDEKIYINENNIVCSINNVVQENVTYKALDYKDLPSTLEKGLIAEGYVAYEVTKGSKSFDLTYEDITIHIDAK